VKVVGAMVYIQLVDVDISVERRVEMVPSFVETTTVVVLLMNYNDNRRYTMTMLAMTSKFL
jgi:hypothetical protein